MFFFFLTIKAGYGAISTKMKRKEKAMRMPLGQDVTASF